MEVGRGRRAREGQSKAGAGTVGGAGKGPFCRCRGSSSCSCFCCPAHSCILKKKNTFFFGPSFTLFCFEGKGGRERKHKNKKKRFSLSFLKFVSRPKL